MVQTAFSNPTYTSMIASDTLNTSLIFDPSLITTFSNNSLSTATSLGSLSGTLSRSGFVGASDTVDFYSVNLTGSSLNVTLTGMSSDADLQVIRDINSNGVVDLGDVVARAERGSSFDESINLSGLASGNYFIRVGQFSGDTNYQLKLSSNFTSNLLATETDLGTLTTTQTFTNPSYAEGETLDRRNGIRSTDTSDIYRFSLSSVRNLSVSLTGLSSDADIRIIQDLNGNYEIDANEVLASSTHGGSLNEAINKNLDAGNYFVQVYRYSGDTNYTLKLGSSAPQIRVNINQIQAIDNPDSGWFGDDADYYARIDIGSGSWTSGVISNANNITPNWNFTQSASSRYVPITIQVWDSDGGIFGSSDDAIDLDASSGLRQVNLTYDLVTGAISGDVAGSAGQTLFVAGSGDSDRARMWFTVNSGDWYTLNLKDSGVQDLTRSFAADGVLSRQDMIDLLRDTKDGSTIDSTELTDLRTVLNSLSYMMPDYVRVLSNKIINSDPANGVSGIGNLFAGASSTRMEQLIGKWFLGNDRPTAISYDRTTTRGYRSVSGNLFQGGISHLDVNQNDLGDCYYLAALGAVARQNTTMIQNMFVSSNDDNGDGVTDSWTVRLFNNGVADYVTVDRFLPTDMWGNAVFAGWGGGNNTNANNELWVALAEKAYAQFNESGWIGQDGTNSYNGTTLSATAVNSNSGGINGGWAEVALRQITGLGADRHGMQDYFLFIPIGNNVADMLSDFNAGKMVVLCTPGGLSGPIVGNHCYTLVGYDAVNDRFQVYNPWQTDGGNSIDGANDGLRWVTRQQLLDNFDEWASLN
jgi:hypothetical protein